MVASASYTEKPKRFVLMGAGLSPASSFLYRSRRCQEADSPRTTVHFGLQLNSSRVGPKTRQDLGISNCIQSRGLYFGVEPMTQEQWTAVDEYVTDLLVVPDSALNAALETRVAAGLPAINVTPGQGKLLHSSFRSVGP